MFVCFIVGLYGLTINLKITGSGYLALPEFGLEKGGKINVIVPKINHTQPIIFLAWKEQYGQVRRLVSRNEGNCQEIEAFSGMDTLFFIKNNLTYIAQRAGIKIPIVAHCQNTSSIIKITYSNPNTYLDLRDKNIPAVATGCSYIYFILSVAWFYNIINFRNLQIPIPVLFCISCITKAIVCNYEIKHWLFLGSHGYEKRIYWILYDIFEILANCTNLCSHIFAIFGWGIYRKHLTFKEYSNIIKHSLLQCFWIAMTTKKLGWGFSVFVNLQLIISVISIISDVTTGIVILTRIENPSNDPILERKLKLLRNYAMTFGSNMLILMFFQIYRILSSESKIQGYMIEHGITILFFVIAIDSFYIREQHNPNNVEGNNQLYINSIDPDSLTLLIEPLNQDLAFFAQG